MPPPTIAFQCHICENIFWSWPYSTEYTCIKCKQCRNLTTGAPVTEKSLAAHRAPWFILEVWLRWFSRDPEPYWHQTSDHCLYHARTHQLLLEVAPGYWRLTHSDQADWLHTVMHNRYYKNVYK